jgi:hypothetical protein
MANNKKLHIDEETRFRIFSAFTDIIDKETRVVDYRKFWSISEDLLNLECLLPFPKQVTTIGFLIEVLANKGVFFYIEKAEEEMSFELNSLKERVLGFYNSKGFDHKLDLVSYRQTIVHPTQVSVRGSCGPRDRYKLAFIKTEDFLVKEQFYYC